MSVFSPVFQKTCLKCVILVLLCSAVSQVYSQAVVHNGDLNIESDGDVPDNVTSITHITGSLNVEGNISSFPDFSGLEMVDLSINLGSAGAGLSNTSLTTLNAIFPALTTVGRSLNIISNSSLTSISGFDVLQSIGRDLFISYNKSLISIPEFSGLERIGGNLKLGAPIFWGLAGNPSLTSFPGFDMLEHIGSDILIASNKVLTSVTRFNSLHSVGGGILIYGNDKLTVLDSMFPVLKTVGKEILFTLNIELTSISGFYLLQIIGVTLNIHTNKALISIPEFPLLDTISGKLNIKNNVKLAGIYGFNSLQSVSDINISTNLSLANISGFNALANTTAITVRDNPSLAGIAGFTMLSSVSSVLLIYRNYSLTALSAFSSLRHIGRSLDATRTPLTVTNNASLTDTDALTSFARSTLPASYTLGGTGMALFENNGGGSYPGGNLAILSDALIPANIASITHVTGNLTIGGDMSAFPELTSLRVVEGDISIGNDFPLSNSSLTVLNDIFPSLLRVNNNLIISRNSFLTSVAGFNLTGTIGRSVSIKHNPLLTSIPKFDALMTVGRSVSIGDNDNLMFVSGFNLLNSTGNLIISRNSFLTTVSGFNTLHTLGWLLAVSGNPLLTNVHLPAFRSVGGSAHPLFTPIKIYDNPVLADCGIVRPFLLDSPSYTLGGTKDVYVHNNAAGCTSAANILAEDVHLNLSTEPSAVDGLSPASGVFLLTIDISNSEASWSITKEDGASFVTLPVASGRQDSTLEVSYSMNTKDAERTAAVTVTVTNGSGMTADSTFTISQTGMASSALSAISAPSKGLKIYPNPGTGHFVIEYNTLGAKVRLLDLTGKILPVDKYMTNKTDTGIVFDLSSLKKGIYIVMLDNQRVRLFLK